MGRIVLRVALAALLMGGALGLERQLDRLDPWSRVVTPAGDFWELRDDGRALTTLSQRDPGLTLAPGQRLVLSDEAPLARLELTAVRPGAPAALELTLPLPDERALLARVWPDEPYRVALVERAADGSERSLAEGLASIPRPDGPAAPPGHEVFARLSQYTGFQCALELRGRRVDLSLAGVPLVSASLDAAPVGAASVSARGGPMTLRALSLTARAAAPSQAPALREESFKALPHPPRGLGSRLGPPLVLLACAALILAALCRRSPPPWILGEATAMGLAPAAVVLGGSLISPLSHLSLLVGGALLAGLPPALLRLRAAGLLPSAGGSGAASTAETRGRAIRRMVVAGVVAATTLVVISHHRLLVLEPLLAAEAQARAAPLPAPPVLPSEVTLDRTSALTIPGPFRDLELTARVTLGPGAILELRTRAPELDAARGHALFVPADDVPGPPGATSAGARWVWEEAGLFAPMGEPGPRLPAGEPTALRVAASGRVLSAWLGERAEVVPEDTGDVRPWRANRPMARTASLRLPAGHLVLLAARGEVRLQDLSVTPRPPAASPDPVPAAWRTSGLPLLAALALGLLGMHLLGLSLGASLEPQVLALLPLPLVLLAFARDGALDSSRLLAAVVATVVLSSLPALLAPGARRGRRLAAVLLAALAPSAAYPAATEQPVPLDGRAVNALSYVDTHAEPLAAERLHLEHPLFRRWNGWLADHAFRGRRPAPAPAPGSSRVVVLGGSSTWGYHLPAAGGLDWPARVGRLVDTAERPVELLNAAWPAATGHHIAPFLQHELLALSPDCVVICLRYNDSFALARPDEQAWLARRLEQGTPWSGWEARHDRAEARRAQRAFAQGLVRGEQLSRPQSAPWPGGQEPPVVFASLLHQMITASADAGADVLLVIEGIAPGHDVPWAEPLADAMAQVARDADVALVDPRSELGAAGSAALFMDVVHLTAEGHGVMAEALAPALAELLDQRRARTR